MKIQSIALTALVLSMVFSNVIPQVSAQSDPDSLLVLATHARDQLKIKLSQFDETPDEISALYEQSVIETEALAKAVAENDIPLAEQHFTTAMKLFKEISRKISDLSSIETTLADDKAKLETKIDRAEERAKRLKAIAVKNDVTIDFAEFDEMIQTMRQNLSEGHFDEVRKTLEETKEFLIDAHKSLKHTADQKKTDRAKRFAEKHIDRLNIIIDEAKALGISQDIIDDFVSAVTQLHESSDTDEIVKLVKAIKTMKKEFKYSKVDRIHDKIQELEAKLDQIEERVQAHLSDRGEEMREEHKPDGVGLERAIQVIGDKSEELRIKAETARGILDKVRESIAADKLGDVVSMLKSLSSKISDIEDSLGEESETRPTGEQRLEKENDNKIERIENKIQKLEDKINRFVDQVSGDQAAEELLRQANSLLQDAKAQLNDSTDKAIQTLKQVDKILDKIKILVNSS